MADKNNGGDKTEKPTPKRLKDARKKGDVAKSKDVTSTIVLALWLVLFSISMSYIGERITSFTSTILSVPTDNFIYSLQIIGKEAINTLLIITALLLCPIVALTLLIEFLQTGPILTFDKMKPKMEHLNPASGIKRMFSMDNLMEVLKSIAKTAILFFIGWLIFKHFLAQIMLIPLASVTVIGEGIWDTVFNFCIWTISVFVFIAILDSAYQRHSFIKKMRMSMRDIKQEVKDSEGDPMVKQERRQLHHEWSEQSSVQAATNANVLIVNPTHIAIALNYDRDNTPVPVVSAKGENHIAKRMREAAEEAGIPIIRNIELARTLLRESTEGNIIPRELFDIIAEVIIWANEVTEEIERQKYHTNQAPSESLQNPPGEDLTHYPPTYTNMETKYS